MGSNTFDKKGVHGAWADNIVQFTHSANYEQWSFIGLFSLGACPCATVWALVGEFNPALCFILHHYNIFSVTTSQFIETAR